MRSLPIYMLCLMLLASLSACARSKKATASSAAFVVLTATEQRTNPGRREMSPFTTYSFKIIWKSKSTPVTFFWKPDATSWIETSMTKPVTRPGINPGDRMVIERGITGPAVRYGDTLVINTVRHSHDEEPMPTAVKKMPTASLYYQTATGGGKWMYVPVTLRKSPNINMP